MARKATDLLDVFRFNNEDGKDDHERKKRRKAAATGTRKRKSARRAAGKSSGGFEGIHLSPRHLLLASCACVLLLVLSFTLGLATGRPSGSARQAPALKRETPVVIRTKLPLIDPANSKPTDPKRIRRKLRHEHGIKDHHLRIWRDGSYLVLEVGPFQSEASARSYLRSSGLELAHINMEDPFRWPEILPYARRGPAGGR